MVTTMMEDGFGVAAWLLATVEDKFACGVECRAVEARCHRAIERVTRVLNVDNDCHAAK